MDWGKVVFVFFNLMSLTSIAGYLYEQTAVMLFIAASVNIISTILKIGVKHTLAAEMLASSLVADLHLVPAFVYEQALNGGNVAIALAVGALVANIFSAALIIVEGAKSNDVEY
ncbi:hypothetical protein CCZ01_04555 [Helicobacter monodelphidis]|uniref:DUF6394 family protein n=1 Tax=Helicobacter sp. 15-1451 TaxID=2004995 RepID=UPI000DCEA673|nr:DUF6394 family protein [Helicobacter sp. 15-1451]RAX57905.1 hypothetical protein CCZ01_04555 [Helicobacter sp. 15-1451]